MSYANGTTHYNLPLTQGTDKRDWSDTNQAFEDLDAAVYQASSDATGALSAAQGAQTTADNASTAASSAVTTANAASASAASAAETAALARTEAQSASSTASSAESTAQSAATQASNADTVALAAQANIGTMSNLNTQDKTSLVAAINEVLGQIGGGTMFPDYANSVNISSGSYTVPSDGYLDLSIVGNAGSSGQDITVNGKSVMGEFVSGASGLVSKLYPVKTGDVIAASIGSLNTSRQNRCVFLPARA